MLLQKTPDEELLIIAKILLIFLENFAEIYLEIR